MGILPGSPKAPRGGRPAGGQRKKIVNSQEKSHVKWTYSRRKAKVGQNRGRRY